MIGVVLLMLAVGALQPAAAVRPAHIKSGDVTDRAYPAEARAAGDEGIVGIEFTIDAKGRVQSCSAVAPSGNTLLDRASCDVVDKWRYVPSRDAAGKAVGQQITQRFAWRVATPCPPADKATICITAPKSR